MSYSIALPLDPGVPAHAAEDQNAAQDLQGSGDLRKEEGGHHRRGHGLAELGGGDEGGGEEFQAPAEDAVAQNGGENRQQRAHQNGAGAVGEEVLALDGAGGHQHGGAGGVDHVGVHRGGGLFPDHPADEGVHRHGNGGQQRQHVAVELGAAAGIGVGDEATAGQGHSDGADGLERELSLEEQAEAKADPDDLRADDGGGAGDAGVAQGLKPQHEVDGKKQTAQAAQQHQLSGKPQHFLSHRGLAQHHGGQEQHRPQQPEGRRHRGGGGGIFDKDRRQGDAQHADHDHDHGMFFEIAHNVFLSLGTTGILSQERPHGNRCCSDLYGKRNALGRRPDKTV